MVKSCGRREATRALAGRIGGNPVVCDERDRDRYGRIVAMCRITVGDLNAWIVTEGWRANRRYCRDYAEESWARAAKRGVVSGRGRRALGVAQGRATWGCPVDDAARERAVQHQVQHQGQLRQERHAQLPRAGRTVRPDPNQYVEVERWFCTAPRANRGRRVGGFHDNRSGTAAGRSSRESAKTCRALGRRVRY